MAQGSFVESSVSRPLDIVEDDILTEEAEQPIDGRFVDEPLPPEADGVELTAAEQAEQERLDILRTKALRAGWVPREQFHGNQADWRDFEEFVRRGEEIAAIATRQTRGAEARADKLEKDVKDLRAIVDQQGGTIKQLREMNAQAEQRGYDHAIADLKTKRREAAAASDMVAFAEYDEQIEGLEAQRDTARAAAPEPAPAPKPADQPQPAPQVLQPEVETFMAANPWFMKDEELNKAMVQEHLALLEAAPAMGLADNLEVAKSRVQKRFPEKFGMATSSKDTNGSRPRRPAPHIPGSGGPSSRQARASGIAAIVDPVEREQVRQGYESARRTMPDLSEQVYLEMYNDPKGDVLDLQRRETERRNAGQQRRRA